jgi:preprotein translocase subunit SecF
MSDPTDLSDLSTPSDGGADSASPLVSRKGGLWHRLYHGETAVDFVALRRWGFLLSGVVLAVSLVSLVTRGLDLGIEFKGGVTWEYAQGTTTTADARSVVVAQGIPDGEVKVQELDSRSEGRRIRVTTGPQDQDVITTVRNALAQRASVDPQEVGVQSVGPSWGDEITESALRALVVFFVIISAYLAVRLEWKMAVATLVAVIHDVLVSVGIYSILGLNVSPATVIAFLTILGYSLYDTIVVFDKVQENGRKLSGGRFTYSDVVNLSMNQTLMRTLNTTLSSILPVVSLLVVGTLIMGATALQDFAVALLIGMITGSYSSIFIAAPLLAIMKEREPRYRQLRERATGGADIAAIRAAASSARAVRAAGATAGGPTSSSTSSVAPVTPRRPPAAGTTVIPPRPRKKKRR